MKKLLLCGATHGSNFGDSLFAYMFKSTIESEYKDVKILFTKVSNYSRDELGLKKATINDIISCDAMVYISGGYFGQSHNETFKQSIKRFITYYTYGLLASLRKVPIAVIGAGVGPLNRKFLKRVVIHIFNKSKVKLVRDDVSKYYIMKYGGKGDILVTTDSALAINFEPFNIDCSIPKLLESPKIKERKKILVHVTHHTGKELYQKNVIEAIIKTLCEDENNGFIISLDTNTQSEVLRNVYNKFPKERTVMYDYKNPIEFLSLLNSVDSIITPKLHVGIIGCAYEKPVLSFAVHPGKTKRFYDQIGYPEHCISLYELSEETAIDIIREFAFEKIIISETIKKKAVTNFELLHMFLKEYLYEYVSNT